MGNGHDACSQHNRYGALAALLGQGMARQRIRDGMRAIDYLLSRDDVMKDGEAKRVRPDCHRYAKQSSAELIAEGAIS